MTLCNIAFLPHLIDSFWKLLSQKEPHLSLRDVTEQHNILISNLSVRCKDEMEFWVFSFGEDVLCVERETKERCDH